ncbi:MAG TPA: glycosyltransferase, partial [Desulfobacteraceae bacterium]|nr:glycosyltransferase [Desulfobacteraceae bacterium]
MSFLFFLAVITFIMTMLYTIEVALGLRRLRNLNDIRPFSGPSRPRVSIIVPACNEEETIETAMLSLVNQDYGPFEIVVINDRSTDRTGAILEKLAAQYPRIRLLEVTELPPGWLGKNHALHCGARAAGGDYLLFTDADVLLEKTTVARAMTIMVAERLDHLSLIFKNIASGSLLNAMIQDAGAALFFLFKPWAARNPRSRYFMGVGAFNLVKKDVYRRIGGHESIRMHPIDDIMLGKVIKQHGFRQDCL